MDLLAGVHVISFNHFLLGPVGTQVIADLGADVICVEPVEGGYQRHWSAVNSMARAFCRSAVIETNAAWRSISRHRKACRL